MLNRLRSAFIYDQFLRRGNTLLITLMTVVLVVGLVSLSSEHVSSDVKLEKLNNDRLRAKNTAESMVVILEKNLNDKATNATASLQIDLGDETIGTERWFGKLANELDQVGFDYGYRSMLDANGNVILNSDGSVRREFKPAIKPLYFNGCAIRWRIEPVKLMSKTVTPVTDSSAPFFVNSERDTSLQDNRRDAAGTNLIPNEAKHFFFRIVIEAYALEDPAERYNGVSTLAPWALLSSGQPDPLAQRYSDKAQVQRVLEFQDTNPFLYLVYYKSDDPTGDLEIDPASSLNLKIGSIRTNHRMFLSSPTSTSVTIGAATTTLDNRPVKVEASAGIYRLSKVDTYKNNVTAISASTRNDDNTEGGSVSLNGTPLTTLSDTRRDPDLTVFTVGEVKGSVPADMNFYSNSAFMEPINRVAQGVNYFTHPGGVISLFLVHPTAGTTGTRTGFATDMLLFRFPVGGVSSTNFFRDIYPIHPIPAPVLATLVDTTGVDLGNSGFTGTPRVPAVYGPSEPVETENGTVMVRGPLITPEIPEIINWTDPIPSVPELDPTKNPYALSTMRKAGLPPTFCLKMPIVPRLGYIYTGPVPDYQTDYAGVIGAYQRNPNTGLLIRERGVFGGVPPTDPIAHNAWMALNYVVYLGKKAENIWTGPPDTTRILTNDNWINVDITDEFFAYSALSAGTIRNLMLHQDEFINRREEQWQAANSTVNALTINMQRVQQFLQQVVVNSAASRKFPSGGRYGNYFNGRIYLERTNHYATGVLDPLAPNGYHPLIVGGNNPAAPTVIVGRVDDGSDNTLGLGQGDWTAYPSTKAIRIDNAASITRQIGIYSPHTCYIWGDFNRNDRQGISIYADSMVALSSAWNDSDALVKSASQNGITINAVIVTNNVPTDKENDVDGGSGGVENIFRLLEDWEDKPFIFKGSIIVSGRAKYTRSPIYGQTFHKDPILRFTYDERLETTAGQPLSSPKSSDKKRIFATVSQ